MSVGVGRGYLKMYRRKKYLSQYFKEREETGEMKNNYDMYKCEICCEMFNNRYSSLVHNASHIIIPLARMSFQICQFCLKFFNSLVDLKTHLCEDHGFRFDLACEVVLIRLEDELRSTDTTLSNCVFDVIEENVDDVMERQNSFNDEVKIKTDNDDVLIIEKSEIMNPDYIEIDNVLLNAQIKVQTESKPLFKFEDEDNVEKLNNNNQADDIPVKNLGNKTIFENDVIVSISQDSLCGLDGDDGGGEDDDDGGGNDDKNKKWFPNGYQPNISFKDDSIGNANSLNKVLSFSAPIDYETLVHPGEFSCKRCNKIFQNRLLLIQHETSHMQWRRPRPAFCTHCDRYIARGPRSLHEHVMHCHPDVEPASKQIPKGCTICGLKYVNYTRHRLNYHTSIDAADNIEEESTNENRSTVVMKIMDLCELCYSFFKIRRNCKYVEMGECEFKGRKPCEKCGKEYFVLKSVKRMTITHSRGWKHRKGPLSNQDRLKMIHKRLKNMR